MESLLKLRRFLDATPETRAPAQQACELCGAPAGEPHSHVIDVEERRLMCACRPCYLLFTHSGAGGGRFRSVSEHYRRVHTPALGNVRWEALDIPVGIAFFLKNSKMDRVVAFYPSPAGATESGLPLETWNELVADVPELGTMEPDVEALLMCHGRERACAWIVPIDACYELVGRIRGRWRGFDGGEEVWREIDMFLAGLEEREATSVP